MRFGSSVYCAPDRQKFPCSLVSGKAQKRRSPAGGHWAGERNQQIEKLHHGETSILREGADVGQITPEDVTSRGLPRGTTIVCQLTVRVWQCGRRLSRQRGVEHAPASHGTST